MAPSQLVTPWDSGPTRAYRSAVDTQSMASLLSLVMMAMPSFAICSSMKSISFSMQASICSWAIFDDASLMSVSPSQNSSNPSPVPGPSTSRSTVGSESLNSSATRIVIGSTVEEPDTTTEPVRVGPLQPAMTITSARASAVTADLVVRGAVLRGDTGAHGTDRSWTGVHRQVNER